MQSRRHGDGLHGDGEDVDDTTHTRYHRRRCHTGDDSHDDVDTRRCRRLRFHRHGVVSSSASVTSTASSCMHRLRRRCVYVSTSSSCVSSELSFVFSFCADVVFVSSSASPMVGRPFFSLDEVLVPRTRLHQSQMSRLSKSQAVGMIRANRCFSRFSWRGNIACRIYTKMSAPSRRTLKHAA
jgi:hypothetical protein